MDFSFPPLFAYYVCTREYFFVVRHVQTDMNNDTNFHLHIIHLNLLDIY